jgi:hypothetical protein
LEQFGAGLHLKTAGTTWLEELIGLAEGNGDGGGLVIAKEVYAGALEHMDELCAPYASVIDIDRRKLPPAEAVQGWNSEQFASALRHDQQNKFRRICGNYCTWAKVARNGSIFGRVEACKFGLQKCHRKPLRAAPPAALREEHVRSKPK